MSSPILKLEGVHTHIGAYHILHGVDFEVPTCTPRMTATSEMKRPMPEKSATPMNSDLSERLAGAADVSV